MSEHPDRDSSRGADSSRSRGANSRGQGSIRVHSVVTGTWHEKERVLDLAYDEYYQLREEGVDISPREFAARYPTYCKSVERMIDVEDSLEGVSRVDDDPWPEPGDAFLGFSILGRLGRGATAQVYLASEPALGGRLVALKVAYHGDTEARTLGKLSHPNIVPVHSVQCEELSGMTAVCMPYRGGVTLADVLEELHGRPEPLVAGRQILEAIQRREPVERFDAGEAGPDRILREGSFVEAVTHLGIQLAEALTHTAGQGILHGDLKPSNVLMTPDGRPMLLDFNLSVDTGRDGRHLGGTLPYMPPEQIRQVFLESSEFDALDPRSDVFSLGVILHEMLTGRLPFGEPPASSMGPRAAGETYLAAQRRSSPRITALGGEVDRDVVAAIHDCIALEVADRPESSEVLTQRLRHHFRPAKRARRWAIRHRRALMAAWIAGVILASGISGFITTRPSAAERGLAALERLDHDAALRAFNVALEERPEAAHLRWARGVAYLGLERYDLAVEEFRAAAKTYREALLYECRAFAHLKGGDYPEAGIWYGKASDHASGREEARLRSYRAWALLKSGKQYSDAVAEIEAAITINEYCRTARYLRARLIFNPATRLRTTPDKAVDDIEVALSNGPVDWVRAIDAAHVFAVMLEKYGDENRYFDRLKQNVSLAVDNGMPRAFLKQSWLRRFANEPWYLGEYRRCPERAGTKSGDPFITMPDMQGVLPRIIQEEKISLPSTNA